MQTPIPATLPFAPGQNDQRGDCHGQRPVIPGGLGRRLPS